VRSHRRLWFGANAVRRPGHFSGCSDVAGGLAARVIRSARILRTMRTMSEYVDVDPAVPDRRGAAAHVLRDAPFPRIAGCVAVVVTRGRRERVPARLQRTR
jgi:hypothetical protein